MAQQRQFNSQFQNQQNQWGQQFGAQQALNQGQLDMQQRGMNDQYQMGMLGQYMNSRGMQQANAHQDQNAWNQIQGTNAGVGISNAGLAQQNRQFQQQQQVGMINGMITAGAGYMSANSGGGGAPAPAVANSGFNQSDPNKINWGY
jgi:Zn-dependent alcohol dehydrogenase